MSARGWEELRARREEMGLSLEEVSIATRIGVPYLAALEEGRLDELPEGPYRAAYLRAYREVLDLDEVEDHHVGDDEDAIPQWAVRAGAAVAVLGLLVVATWQVAALTSQGVDGPRGDPLAAVEDGAVEEAEEVLDADLDQRVEVRALETTRLRVEVDGELSWEGRLTAGESLSFAGRDEVAVDLPAAEVARVRWNGETVVPQGRQDVPRRLVFVDDRRDP